MPRRAWPRGEALATRFGGQAYVRSSSAMQDLRAELRG